MCVESTPKGFPRAKAGVFSERHIGRSLTPRGIHTGGHKTLIQGHNGWSPRGRVYSQNEALTHTSDRPDSAHMFSALAGCIGRITSRSNHHSATINPFTVGAASAWRCAAGGADAVCFACLVDLTSCFTGHWRAPSARLLIKGNGPALPWQCRETLSGIRGLWKMLVRGGGGAVAARSAALLPQGPPSQTGSSGFA